MLSYFILLFSGAAHSSPIKRRCERLLVAPVIAAGVASSYRELCRRCGSIRIPGSSRHRSADFDVHSRALGKCNSFGGCLVMALPLVVYFTSRRSGIGRALGIVTVMAVVIAIGLTSPRGLARIRHNCFSSAHVSR